MRQASMTAAIAAAGGFANAQSTFTPAKPPAVPLAVRSPYLNTWLNGDSGGILPGSWPRFWTGQIQGWQGFIAVDGSAYNWLGAATGAPAVTQVSLEYTSLRSIFTMDVDGKVTMTITFFSPVFPDDLSKQSQQFSYVDVKVQSADGNPHSVQVYMDISGEWTSGDVTQVVEWDFDTTNGVSYHKIVLENPVPFVEYGEIAAWGTWFLSTAAGDGVTWKSGQDIVVRGQFLSNGTLDDTADTNFRAVNNDWPVFAFAKDFGNVSGNAQDVVFSLGLVQDQVIQFQGNGSGLTNLPGLWSSFYTSDVDAMVAFYNDYGDASAAADKLDAQIQSDSVAAAGQNYATITTLTVRQTFGGLQFAGTSDSPLIFLKEISSNSDIETVDVIFPAHPLLLYLNPLLVKLLLDPLYINQESGNYPNAWAEHDLGTFPIAKGYPAGNDEAMPLEECGNMIIMTLAYAQRAGDTAYLEQHFPKLEQWAGFLVEEALIPANQLSTDDFAGTLANQTNLALKGIIGLRAMSEIANLTNNTDNWGNTAESYLSQWKGFAINNNASPPHTTLAYGDDDSHGLLYNLYGDRLLSLGFVDQSVYDMQSAFYPTVALEYGVPLDTRHTWTKGDWEMFCAAIASPTTRDMFIEKMATWINETVTDRALTDLYDAGTGGFPVNGPTFVARPVMGGAFALLALQTQSSRASSEAS